MQNLIINITQKNFNLTKNENFGCFLLAETLGLDFITEFTEQARNKKKICLIMGDNAEAIYQQTNAEGVVLDLSNQENPQKILKAFKKNNPKALVGVISRNRRHESMLISECEPEFIIFRVWNEGNEKTLELVEWYSEFFLLQCAIWPQEKFDYTDIPADFIIVNDADIK